MSTITKWAGVRGGGGGGGGGGVHVQCAYFVYDIL